MCCQATVSQCVFHAQVDKSHQTLLSDAAKTGKTLADHCLDVSDLKWNSGAPPCLPWARVSRPLGRHTSTRFCCAGYTLHADIALAVASSEAPTLTVYIRYVLLAFMECLCLERTALLIRKAADVVHDGNVLGMLGDTQPAWLDFNSSSTEENTVATRQLATLMTMLAHCFRLSQSSLQAWLLSTDDLPPCPAVTVLPHARRDTHFSTSWAGWAAVSSPQLC